MAKYKIPIHKPKKEKMEGMVEPSIYQPPVYIPVDPKWLPKLEVDKPITITLKGTVSGIHMDDKKDHKRSDVEIDLDSVEWTGGEEKEIQDTLGDE